ncbi:uncharacterized protein BDR25DRAFT_363836, partial [Lindgomyces ingoldianus]
SSRPPVLIPGLGTGTYLATPSVAAAPVFLQTEAGTKFFFNSNLPPCDPQTSQVRPYWPVLGMNDGFWI